MGQGQLRAALFGVWGAVSLIALLSLVASVLVPHDSFISMPLRCEAQVKDGIACPLCGMTRAFCRISHGRIKEAQALNKLSVPLYLGFVANAFAFPLVAFWRLGQRFVLRQVAIRRGLIPRH